MTNEPNGKRQCVFCGVGKVSNEHVYPIWFRKLFAERSGGKARWVDTSRPDFQEPGLKFVEKLDVKVKRVCEGCNNGWMSQLETKAKPILSPMIMGDNLPISLSGSDQKIVAAWAFKTTLMADFFTRRPIFRQPLHADFFRDKTPPKNCAIWTGAYVSAFGPMAPLLLFRPSIGMVQTLKGIPKVKALSATAVLYFWMFQVLVYGGQPLPTSRLKRITAVDQIWPATDSETSWPRDMTVFTDPTLDDFAQRFEGRQ
jgi:hypothetical protein